MFEKFSAASEMLACSLLNSLVAVYPTELVERRAFFGTGISYSSLSELQLI